MKRLILTILMILTLMTIGLVVYAHADSYVEVKEHYKCNPQDHTDCWYESHPNDWIQK